MFQAIFHRRTVRSAKDDVDTDCGRTPVAAPVKCTVQTGARQLAKQAERTTSTYPTCDLEFCEVGLACTMLWLRKFDYVKNIALLHGRAPILNRTLHGGHEDLLRGPMNKHKTVQGHEASNRSIHAIAGETNQVLALN
jgi:hypothetical protein